MIKVKFHPTFWLLAVAFIMNGRYVYFFATLAAALLHEGAHARVAYTRGYAMKQITLMPYGAMMRGDEKIGKADAVPIIAAGPISNFVTCIVLFALWWAFPATYSYTDCFFDVSFAIGAFNLLPLYPLDGARILLSLSKSPKKTLKILRGAGVTAAFIVFALFLASFFFELNYSLGIIAVMLYLSAIGGTENESYSSLAENAPYLKELTQPIAKVTVMVHHDLKLVRLLRHLKSYQITTFEVVDDELRPITKLTEAEVNELCLKHSLQVPIGKLIKPNNIESGKPLKHFK